VLLVDIDHLKSINDTMGHAFGDVFIRQLGQRLGSVDHHMTACRLGGDEFAVLVDQCGSARDLRAAATKVLRKVEGLIESGVNSMSPSLTIGGAIFDADGADAETLCQNADFALYHAKETNRGGYVRFETGLRTSIIDRANLVRGVDLALVEGRIFPHYQPIIRLDSGEIVGLEALARMRSPHGTIVSAAEFHKALTDPRIAYELTTLMLSAVAADIRKWLDAGIPIQHVGINVTTGDFQRGDLDGRLVNAFDQAGVPLRHVLLEVNEAMYMGGAEGTVAKRVEALRRKGVLVALDDFGTGFASLTHLLTFPVDIIKIDKSFIDKLVTDAPSRVIVAGIIDIARKLGMKIVAEGVETAEQAACLSDLGCNLGQGYHFSRPCSAQDMTTLLRAFAQGLKTWLPWSNAALG
jgi:diguanylate cyclase (GGDEF)-like protein